MKKPTVQTISINFSNIVIIYIKEWMSNNHAEDIDFHRYRMKLLLSLGDNNSASEKLLILLDKIPYKQKFDLIHIISDKMMGEKIAKFIFAKIIVDINNEFKKILEMERDKIKSEINLLIQKSNKLKIKINHH